MPNRELTSLIEKYADTAFAAPEVKRTLDTAKPTIMQYMLHGIIPPAIDVRAMPFPQHKVGMNKTLFT